MNATRHQTQARPAPTPVHRSVLQRRCACGNHTAAGGECASCHEEHIKLQRQETTGASAPGVVPPVVGEVLRSPGQTLNSAAREFFEERLGHDFSGVRVHTDVKAAESARAVGALAYTVGRDVVFGTGQYAPATSGGRRLIAHELTHVVQQRNAGGAVDSCLALGDPGSAAEAEAERAASDVAADRAAHVALREPSRLARAPCTPAATCSPTGVAGSSEDFGQTEAAHEAGPRARRKHMAPVRAVSTGHAGHARQLEHFLNAQAPGRLPIVQGIFIDADMSPGTGAFTENCAAWIAEALPAGAPTPSGMAGATKDCIFVPGHLNREALAFNTTADATIGGIPREQWRIETLQTLTHETEHPRFDTATAGQPAPAGVASATCTRPNVAFSLSELAAVMSEFPVIARAVAAEANPAGPRHADLNFWFQGAVHTGGENITGNLQQMGCFCACPEVAAFVRETFDNVTASGGWSAGEKNAFNTRMRTELPAAGNPAWPL